MLYFPTFDMFDTKLWVIKLSFCRNDSHMGGLFWQKNTLITHILIELCLLWYLAECTFSLLTLYLCKICRLIFSLILFPGNVENERSKILNTIPEVFKAFLNAGHIDLLLRRQGRHCCRYHGNNLLYNLKFSKVKITS